MPPLDPSLVPFWRTATMHGESAILVARGDEPPEASLLFAPREILNVVSAAGDTTFAEGADYMVDRGAARIVRVAGSRMPAVTPEAIACADGGLTHPHTIAITYTHDRDPAMAVPAESLGVVARAPRRLQQRQPVTICVVGDSISEGYDSSGFHGLPPHQPGYARLVADGLEQEYGGPVRLHNFAVAGSTAADALWDTERVAAVKPDLAIVAFGMNDAGYADAGEFAGNVAALVARIRGASPEVEFVLVSPMLPAPACAWVAHDRFGEYRAALAQLAGDGVVFADVTGIWTAMLARKQPHDLSGNGLNHPNDFGHRVYAQVVLDRLR